MSVGAIRPLKRHFYGDGEWRGVSREVSSVDIYGVVPEHGARTPEEFDAYLTARGKPTRSPDRTDPLRRTRWPRSNGSAVLVTASTRRKAHPSAHTPRLPVGTA